MGRSSCYFGSIGTDFDDRQWLSLSRSGAVCIALSVSVHIFAFYEVTRITISQAIMSIFYGVFYVPFALMSFWSLFMAYTSNPGAVPMGAKPLQSGLDVQMRGIRRCRKCNDNFKPARAHHDSNTGRCVVKMDHFCPWICNAVGVYNHKFFILFILYSCLTCITSLTLTTVTYFRCESLADDIPTLLSTEHRIDDWQQSTFRALNGLLIGGNFSVANTTTTPKSSSTRTEPPSEACVAIVSAEALVLFVLSILFLLFTLSMLVEQYDAIKSNISKIARLIIKRDGSNEITDGYDRVSTKFNEIFGGDNATFAWHWLVPVPVWFPDGMHDQVMGYTWDPPLDENDDDEDDDNNNNNSGTLRPYRPEGYADTELSTASPPSLAFGLSKRTSDNDENLRKQERENLIGGTENTLT